MNIDQVKYFCPSYLRRTKHTESAKFLGIDTEAYRTGKCFMVATSLGDVFSIKDFPACLFTRKYRGKKFVAYNLKYDGGAFVQHLSPTALKTLWKTTRVEYGGYRYRAIANKQFTIRKGKNTVTFYDAYNFYGMSLDAAAAAYLDESKLAQDITRYTPQYVRFHWDEIAAYCIHDAILVERLMELIIKRFERIGVYVQKPYSVAYVSYQYFRSTCPYVTVKKYWDKHREVLDYAMQGYNGGKFEVTEKGTGYYYEYDIVSAYPAEISNLVDISWARVVQSSKYRKGAVYGFLRCHIKIPYGVFSPTVVPRGTVNTFPIGEYERVITKAEYEYLTSAGADVKILNAYWLHIDNRQYPYRRQIKRLVALKQLYKTKDDTLYYHTVKILMNSLYGKFVQLIKQGEHYKASTCWNPIYGAVITAACRVKVTVMQQLHPEIVAVHTDSIITAKQLDIGRSPELGEFAYDCEGEGIILGSGVYEVGDKTAFRGFHTKLSLRELLRYNSNKAPVSVMRPFTWREVAFHGWDKKLINYFNEADRKMAVNFDSKRLWLDDWQKWTDVEKRNVSSEPLIVCPALF